jgi:hypothetical protein
MTGTHSSRPATMSPGRTLKVASRVHPAAGSHRRRSPPFAMWQRPAVPSVGYRRCSLGQDSGRRGRGQGQTRIRQQVTPSAMWDASDRDHGLSPDAALEIRLPAAQPGADSGVRWHCRCGVPLRPRLVLGERRGRRCGSHWPLPAAGLDQGVVVRKRPRVMQAALRLEPTGEQPVDSASDRSERPRSRDPF